LANTGFAEFEGTFVVTHPNLKVETKVKMVHNSTPARAGRPATSQRGIRFVVWAEHSLPTTSLRFSVLGCFGSTGPGREAVANDYSISRMLPSLQYFCSQHA